MAAFYGNMASNYGMDRLEILSVLQVYSRLFLNNLCVIFGKEKRSVLHLPSQSKSFTNYFHKLWLL
jgi:hypothetical protein